MGNSSGVYKPSKRAIELQNKIQRFVALNTKHGRQRNKMINEEIELGNEVLQAFWRKEMVNQSIILRNLLVCIHPKSVSLLLYDSCKHIIYSERKEEEKKTF